MAFIHCSLPVWGTGSVLYKTGCNQHLTQDLFFQVMELRAIGCSTACTGMCVLTLLCFPGQPGSCSSSLESMLAAGLLEAGTCPALLCRLCSHLEAMVCWSPTACTAPGSLCPSPWVCSPAWLCAGLPRASSSASGLLCPVSCLCHQGWMVTETWESFLSADQCLSLGFFSHLTFPLVFLLPSLW